VSSPPAISAKLPADLSGKLLDPITKLGQRKTADACKKIEDFVSKVAMRRPGALSRPRWPRTG